MDKREIRTVYGGLCAHFAVIDTGAKKELQDKCIELKAQIAELDVSAREQLQDECVEATNLLAKLSDDIDVLDVMIIDLENIINDTADAVADKQKLSDWSREKYRRMLNYCRDCVGNLLWLQKFAKKEISYAAQNRKAAREELQQMQDVLKKRRRLQRELAMTERRLKRVEQMEANPPKNCILR